jgi:hypothetical protein
METKCKADKHVQLPVHGLLGTQTTKNFSFADFSKELLRATPSCCHTDQWLMLQKYLHEKFLSALPS